MGVSWKPLKKTKKKKKQTNEKSPPLPSTCRPIEPARTQFAIASDEGSLASTSRGAVSDRVYPALLRKLEQWRSRLVRPSTHSNIAIAPGHHTARFHVEYVMLQNEAVKQMLAVRERELTHLEKWMNNIAIVSALLVGCISSLLSMGITDVAMDYSTNLTFVILSFIGTFCGTYSFCMCEQTSRLRSLCPHPTAFVQEFIRCTVGVSIGAGRTYRVSAKGEQSRVCLSRMVWFIRLMFCVRQGSFDH